MAAAVVVPNNPPTVATAIDQSATAGRRSAMVPGEHVQRPDTGDTLSYTPKADGGAAHVAGLHAGTRTFSGRRRPSTGTVSVKVTASDGNGGRSAIPSTSRCADTTPPTLTSVEVLDVR